MGPLKETSWDSRSLWSDSATISTCFYSQKLWVLLFLALEPWAGGACCGAGLIAPEIYRLNFYAPHMDVGPACSMSPSLLPVWMDVVSLIS